MPDVTTRGGPLRVLHAGPLDSIHLARWAELTEELGHVPLVAGHLRRGFATARLPAAVDGHHRAWQLPWASRRGAQVTGRAVHRALASLPNALVEVPVWAAWLRGLARRLQPDVIHTHWLPYWGAAAALSGLRPFIAGAMGSDVYLLDGVDRRLADLALTRCAAAVAPSPHAAAELRVRGAPAGRCVHLEPGIDLEEFRPATQAERSAAKRALGLSDAPVVLSFRGTSPVYGLELAIDAFARLKQRLPDAQLLVVHGRIPLDDECSAAVVRLGASARVLGAVPHAQMRACFHAADVGVSVPTSDGSPASLWECLACGTPAVCSPLPQLVERLGADGGVAFAERTPAAVASALASVLAYRDRARSMGLAGRAWCEANVDRRESLVRLDRLYRGLVSPSADRGLQAGDAVTDAARETSGAEGRTAHPATA